MIRCEFGRQICGDLDAASQREWLVTDGLGGYAMGTVGGLRTRRYHGLLIVGVPRWRWSVGDVTLEMEVAATHGRAGVGVTYRLVRSPRAIASKALGIAPAVIGTATFTTGKKPNGV